jgi:hypothetical protein
MYSIHTFINNQEENQLKTNKIILGFLGLGALTLLAFTSFSLPGIDSKQSQGKPANTLLEAVRQSTERFTAVEEAEAAGYSLFHGCVSGPQEGAMGVHYVNGNLVGDGILDPLQPEALIYEAGKDKMQLAGVEYVVIAEAWHANNETPPVLMGQVFNYVSSPNRYGIPAFYELHVWAWKSNPNGTFADWNPTISCDEYTGEAVMHEPGQ